MKNTLSHLSRAGTPPTLLALGCLLALGSVPAGATPLYWDDNGTTAGASSTPAGTWGTDSFWNSDSTGGNGGSFQAATTSADNLTFVAAQTTTAVTSAFTVGLNGDQAANNLSFEYVNSSANTGNTITLGTAVGAQTITLTGSGTVHASSTGTFLITGGPTNSSADSPFVVINANLAVSGDQEVLVNRGGMTFNGGISGTANLWFWGAGTKTITGANTYIGTTNVRANLTLGGAAGSFGTGTVTLFDASTVLIFNHTADFTFANNITGLGASSGVTKLGTTTLTLTGTNDYSGGTVIRGGAIKVGSIATNLGAGTIKLGSVSGDTGTLIYNGTGETTTKTIQVNAASGASLQSDGTGALVVSSGISAGSSGTKTFTLKGSNTGNNSVGAITNGSATTFNLNKADAGKWILTSTNTYTGTTALSGGTLLINGDSSGATGAVSVGSTGTLGGAGTIGGATTAASGSFLSAGPAGNTAGTLTFTSTLDVSGLAAGTGGLLFDLGATGSSDKIVSGALTIGAGVLNFDDFSFTTLGGFGGGAYTLFSATSIVGTLGSGLNGTVGGLSGVLSVSGNNILLTVTAVPEPSSYAAVLGGFALLITAFRLRRRT